MRITLNSNRTNFPTGVQIEESFWDKDRQLIKGSNELANAYNRQLLTLRAKAWDYYSESIRKKSSLL